MEIERRFLPDANHPMIRQLHSCGEVQIISQGYLAVDDARSASVRVRSILPGSYYWLTTKQGAGLAKHEVEIQLSEQQFSELWPLTLDRRVTKRRHIAPLVAGLSIELDTFLGALSGLLIAEIEFPTLTQAETFVAPEWLGVEITHDRRYANSTLACLGLPPVTTSQA